MLVKDQKPNKVLKYMLIGEAPGASEEYNGRPFVGAAGELLNTLLLEAGIDRDDECYVTNVVQLRPKNNNFEQFYRDKSRKLPTAKLIKAYQELEAKIMLLQPSIIILLGNEALKAVTGHTGITKIRGTIMSFRGTQIQMIPTFHPAMLVRLGGLMARCAVDMLEDLRLARRLANGEFNQIRKKTSGQP